MDIPQRTAFIHFVKLNVATSSSSTCCYLECSASEVRGLCFEGKCRTLSYTSKKTATTHHMPTAYSGSNRRKEAVYIAFLLGTCMDQIKYPTCHARTKLIRGRN